MSKEDLRNSKTLKAMQEFVTEYRCHMWNVQLHTTPTPLAEQCLNGPNITSRAFGHPKRPSASPILLIRSVCQLPFDSQYGVC